MKVAVALLALLVTDPQVIWARQREAGVSGSQQPATTAAIGGRVVVLGSGAPLRGAEVRAVTADGNSRLTMTDADGRFELRDLTPARWAITASKAGFVSQQFGQRRPSEPVQPIDLTNRQVFTADFTLMRGGVIAGHVFDQFGEPVAGVRVQIMRLRTFRGNRQLEPTSGMDQTDDLGAFRLFGLAPGDYYISASMRAAPCDRPAPTRTDASTSRRCHPTGTIAPLPSSTSKMVTSRTRSSFRGSGTEPPAFHSTPARESASTSGCQVAKTGACCTTSSNRRRAQRTRQWLS